MFSDKFRNDGLTKIVNGTSSFVVNYKISILNIFQIESLIIRLY